MVVHFISVIMRNCVYVGFVQLITDYIGLALFYLTIFILINQPINTIMPYNSEVFLISHGTTLPI